MPRARLETPQLRPRAGIQREKLAFGIAGEHQVARGREHRSQQHVFVRITPHPLARDRVPRIHVTVRLAIGRQLQIPTAAHEEPAFLRRLMLGRYIHANFERRRIDQPGARRVRHFVPAFCTRRRRTNVHRLAHLGLSPPHQLSIFCDARNPSLHFRNREHANEFSGHSVQAQTSRRSCSYEPAAFASAHSPCDPSGCIRTPNQNPKHRSGSPGNASAACRCPGRAPPRLRCKDSHPSSP